MAEVEKSQSELEIGGRRGRAAVAASILAALLVGAYFVAAPGEIAGVPPGFVISGVVLVIAFWFPAMRLGRPADIAEGLLPLVAWLLAWTLVWDLATSGLTTTRTLFQEWWIVYPSGVLFFLALLGFHAFVVGRVETRPPDQG